MTLLELLIVIAILAILISLLIPGMGKAKEVAVGAQNTANVRQLAAALITWSADNGNRMMSPEYPGGMTPPGSMSPDDFFPQNYNIGATDLWLDNVAFAHIYMQPNKYGVVTQFDFNDNSTHLKGTVFENTQSVRQVPEENDWKRHSYAMNANIQYDRKYDVDSSGDPWLTEKTLSNIPFAPNAMFLISCTEQNVVKFEDLSLIEDSVVERWGPKGKAIVAFLDGHTERLRPEQIPSQDPNSDLESSRFWRGVNPD